MQKPEGVQEKERLYLVMRDASLGGKQKPPKVRAASALKFQKHQKLQISRFFIEETRPWYFETYENLCFAAPPGTIKIVFRILFFEYGVSLCGFCIKCAVKLYVLTKYLPESLHFSLISPHYRIGALRATSYRRSLFPPVEIFSHGWPRERSTCPVLRRKTGKS